MKTMKCDLCEANASGESFEAWMKNLMPHYMEAHADVINDSSKTEADRDAWMAENRARFETANEADVKNGKCDSCLMPMHKDPGNSGSDKYCSYCYRDGDFVYKGHDVKEFQKRAKKGMIENGMNPLLASFFAWTIKFAPRWKKK